MTKTRKTALKHNDEEQAARHWRPYALHDDARDEKLTADIITVNRKCEAGSDRHNSSLMFLFSKHLYELCLAGGEWHDVEHLLRSMIGCLLSFRTGHGVVLLPHPHTVPEDLMKNWVKPMLKSMGTCLIAQDAAITREIAGTGQRLTLVTNEGAAEEETPGPIPAA